MKISIDNSLDKLSAAMENFETFAETHNVSMPIMMKVNIVIDELLSNIIKYGFPDHQETQIEMAMRLEEGSLTIVFSDNGIPFNPFQITPPDLTIPIEEREIGGLGIHLTRKLMDEHSYRRENNRNIVTIVKHSAC